MLVLRRSVVFFSTGFVYSAHLCSWRRVCCDFGLFQLHWNCRQTRLHCCWVLCSMVLPFLFSFPLLIWFLRKQDSHFWFQTKREKYFHSTYLRVSFFLMTWEVNDGLSIFFSFYLVLCVFLATKQNWCVFCVNESLLL